MAERTSQFTIMQGHNYTSHFALELYLGNQIPREVVDFLLPDHVQDLPPSLHIPNRFWVASQFGAGPAMSYRIIYQSQMVPLRRNVPMATVLEYKLQNQGKRILQGVRPQRVPERQDVASCR